MARIVDFYDGAQSETAPTIGNIIASGIITYPDDATYEANEQGSPAAGNIYFNTTSSFLRYHNGTTWIDIVDDESLQVLIMKDIDADNNIITNIANDEIKAGAAIDVTKLHDGSVDNTEFGYLDGVTSGIQGQIDAKLDKPTVTDNRLIKADGTDNIQESGITVDDSDNVTGVNDLTVGGDLTVNGTTTSINTATLEVEDANITINDGGTDGTAEGAGLTVERTGTDGSISYEDALTSKFKIGALGSEVEIADVSSSQQITNKDIDGGTATDTSRLTLPKATTAALDALTDKEASVAYDTDLQTVVYNDGTDWKELSGGGSGEGGINYITNPDAEIDLSGWNTYNDGASSIPVDGTGGTPSSVGITSVSIASDIIRGTKSFGFTKGSLVSSQGQGYSSDITIENADINSKLQFEFEYYITGTPATGYNSGDIKAYIYDIDNAVLLGAVSNDEDGDVLFTESIGKFIGEFYTTDSLNYRVILHNTSTNTNDYILVADSIKVRPIDQQLSVSLTDWQSFTPTGTWTTNTTYTGQYRRVGDSLEVNVFVQLSGAPNAATLNIDIPNSLVADTSAMAVSTTAGIIGEAKYSDNSLAEAQGLVSLFSTTAIQPQLEIIVGNNDVVAATQTTPHTWAINDSISIHYIVPIVGWTATNVVSNNELNQKAVIVNAVGNSGGAVTANVTDIDFTEVIDTNNAWDGSTFTAGSTGTYNINGFIRSTAAVAPVLQVYVNGIASRIAGFNGGDAVLSHGFNVSAYLAKGDVISLRSNAGFTLDNSTPGFHWIGITSSPDFTSYGVINPNTKIIESTSPLTNYTIPVSQYGDLTSITLSAGTWDITSIVYFFNNGVVTAATVQVGVSTTPGNSSAGLILGDNSAGASVPTTNGHQTVVPNPTYTVTHNSDTTYYLKSYRNSSITNQQVYYKIHARRMN